MADIALNRSLRQERVNTNLHGLERLLWEDIAHSLDQFQNHVYEADAIIDFRENLKHAAHEAMDAARMRVDQYVKCASVRSNNRGRFLQLKADEHIAHGLLLLAAHCDEDEPEQFDQGRARYCHNAVIAELVQFLWDHAHPAVTNRHDITERWCSNVELWIARDHQKAHGISFYDLALRQAPRALLRAREEDLF